MGGSLARTTTIWVSFLLAAALALRLFHLGTHSLWLDEGYSLDIAATSLQQIWGNTNSAHPPLYYLLLHFWLSLGRSEAMLRLPSVIVGTLSVPLVYALARLWWARKVALLSALLLALSPLLVWYSQEVRMYSLVAFLGLLSTLALSLAIKRGNPVWWTLYFASALAGLYTHYGMLVLLLGQNLWLWAWWARHGRRPGFLIPWLSSQAALALSFLPWLPVLLDNLRGQAGLGSYVFARWESLSAGLPWPLTAVAIVLLALAIGALALRLRPKSRASGAQPGDGWLRLTSFVLYPLLTIASAFPQGVSVKRQLVLFLPFFFLFTAIGLGKAGRRENLAILSLVLLTLLALASSFAQREREDWRGAASLVAAASQPGDVVLFHAGYTRSPFDYYYQGPLPRMEVSLKDLDVQLGEVQARHGRAWVVLSRDVLEDPEGKLRAWLSGRWTLRSQWPFAGVEVRLYDTRSASSAEGIRALAISGVN